MDIFTEVQLGVWRAELVLNGDTLIKIASPRVEPLYPKQASDLRGERLYLSGLIIAAEAANDA